MPEMFGSPRHRWTGLAGVLHCTRCRCTKRAICYVGTFILWTYLRSDGIRFTGQAPACTPAAAAAAERPKTMSAAAGGVIYGR